MSSTPRAKPMVGKEGASPRASTPASKDKAGGEKKPKSKKSKAPTAPVSLGMPMNKPADLTEEAAKNDLVELQKKYGALVVNFNNQQAELAAEQGKAARLEARLARAEAGSGAEPANVEAGLRDEVEKLRGELAALEATNMALQKKVNKLQVEHVSEEEVDQLFYALEVKEEQLEQANKEKADLEQEVLTARQLSARGGAMGEPKFIEIHHHVQEDSDDDDDKKDAEPAPVS